MLDTAATDGTQSLTMYCCCSSRILLLSTAVAFGMTAETMAARRSNSETVCSCSSLPDLVQGMRSCARGKESRYIARLLTSESGTGP